MKFVGKGLLLEVSSYQTKVDPSEEGKEPTLEWRYRYVFLIGDQADKNSFIENAHVESCIADHPLLSNAVVFDEVDVEISVREFFVKGQGKVQKPVYTVVDKVGQ